MNINKIERAKKEYTKFNENLKFFREKNGYTAKELAKLIGIPNNTYTAYETKNREPSFAVLIKIANALNITIDELLDNKQTKFDKYINTCQRIGFKFYSDAKRENKGITKNEIAFTVSDTERWQNAFHIDTGEPVFILSKEEFISSVEKVLYSQELSINFFSMLFKKFNDASLKHILIESISLIMKGLNYTESTLHINKPLKDLSFKELIQLNNKLSLELEIKNSPANKNHQD